MAMPNVPWVKERQTWIDKRGKPKQIPLKVICPAMGRTGTTSMRVALWDLGYEPYHGWNLFENPPDSALWQEAMEAKFEGKGRLYTRKDFDSILYDSDAILDIPGSLFAEELIDAYPEAKVVMTTRDIDTWHQSCLVTFVPYRNPPLFLTILAYLDRALGLYFPAFTMVLKHQYGDQDFATKGKDLYRRHLARVRQKMLNAGREADYLEFNVQEGWEPLCNFLGRDVPLDEEGKPKPFPKTNDREAFTHAFDPYFASLFRKFLWIGFAWSLPIAALVGAWWWKSSFS